MTMHRFIFSNEPFHRVTRHLVFWLTYSLYFWLQSITALNVKDVYLNEAKKLARPLLLNAYSSETKNNSLYKGDIGIALFFTELAHPQYARMPLFE